MMMNQDVDGYTKPYIVGKYSKKRKEQQPTENQKNDKTECKLSVGLVFTFSFPGGGRVSLLASRQFHQGWANFFARRTGFSLALFWDRPSIKSIK